MSVEMVVFLSDDRMITPQQWQSAIRQYGFDLDLDTNFDVEEFMGFLPCRYKGEECGFEYSRITVAEAEPPPDVQTQIGGRDIAISFVTHSNFRDLMASVIASGVLCSQTEGVLFDTEADSFMAGADTIQWTRSGEAEISKDL